MVKEVSLHQRALGSAEQRTARTVVADDIVTEHHLGRPLEILDAIFTVGYVGRQNLLELYPELLATGKLLLVIGSNLHNAVTLGNLHYIGTHELHTVTCTAPIEAIGLTMHVTAHQSMVIQSFSNAQICTVHIDGIIHHALVDTACRNNLSLAAREVRSIGLRGKIAFIAASADYEAFKRYILGNLSKKAHALGIIHRSTLY